MAKKIKLIPSLLNEFWEVERVDCYLGGFTYRRQRVFCCCARTKQQVKDSMAEYKKRMCE